MKTITIKIKNMPDKLLDMLWQTMIDAKLKEEKQVLARPKDDLVIIDAHLCYVAEGDIAETMTDLISSAVALYTSFPNIKLEE